MSKELGYLAMCADRRFWQKTIAKFEELTGLSSEQGDFWIEAKAGGTPGISDYGLAGARGFLRRKKYLST